MRANVGCALSLFLLVAVTARGQLVVTEVMYDPISNEDRWEWIEVHNRGAEPIDLDGVIIDRVGDQERRTPTPNIASRVDDGGRLIDNPTVIPAGGVAVLYHGPGLGYDPDRFLAAWPNTPVGTTLVGVDGWLSNQLTNSPKTSDYAPSLPALTVGLWRDDAAYLADIADFGSSSRSDRRVFRTDNALTAFGYDDTAPWIDTLERSSLIYVGGPVFQAGSWLRTNYPHGGASQSRKTYLPEPINRTDYGSPGVAPAGAPPSEGVHITELMANPASITGGSNEWEWIEVYNAGPAIDLAATPLWLDDDDGPLLDEANVAEGVLESGVVSLLFNASAASLEDYQEAWARPGWEPINWVPVEDWPALANSGDTVSLWADAGDYNADHPGDDRWADNALVSIAYGDSDPWPLSVDGDSIRLTRFDADPANPASWARARGRRGDPDAYASADVTLPGGVVDNEGGEQASPGFVWPDVVSPPPGDFNVDGRVDAADYVLWRNGAPLPGERLTLGVNDAADLAQWRDHYGREWSRVTPAVPEPAAFGLLAIALTATVVSPRSVTGG